MASGGLFDNTGFSGNFATGYKQLPNNYDGLTTIPSGLPSASISNKFSKATNGIILPTPPESTGLPVQKLTVNAAVNQIKKPPVAAASKKAQMKPPETVSTQTSNLEIDYNLSENPLDKYASYTYTLSMHAIDPFTYANLIASSTNAQKITYVPSHENVLISGGGKNTKYPRNKNFTDVDFYIDDLEIMTVDGMTRETRFANDIKLSFKIYEPYGVSLFNRLNAVAADFNIKDIYDMTYLLIINFYGYDDTGVMIQPNDPAFKKILPFIITSAEFSLTKNGATYSIEAVPYNYQALQTPISQLPIPLNINAGTVGDFFSNAVDTASEENVLAYKRQQIQQSSSSNQYVVVKNFADAVNFYYLNVIDSDGNPMVDTPDEANQIEFQIDPVIAKSLLISSYTPPSDSGLGDNSSNGNTSGYSANGISYSQQFDLSSMFNAGKASDAIPTDASLTKANDNKKYPNSNFTNKQVRLRTLLEQYATKEGITGRSLALFLAQCQVETSYSNFINTGTSGYPYNARGYIQLYGKGNYDTYVPKAIALIRTKYPSYSGSVGTYSIPTTGDDAISSYLDNLFVNNGEPTIISIMTAIIYWKNQGTAKFGSINANANNPAVSDSDAARYASHIVDSNTIRMQDNIQARMGLSNAYLQQFKSANKIAKLNNVTSPTLANNTSTPATTSIGSASGSTQTSSNAASPSTAASSSVTSSPSAQPTSKIDSRIVQSKSISFHAGTDIIDIINTVILDSEYIKSQFKDGTNISSLDDAISANAKGKPLNWFKITTNIIPQKYNDQTGEIAKKYIYKVQPYVVYNTKSASAPSGMPKSVAKIYEYMYTGHNTQILNVDLKFNALYFVMTTGTSGNPDQRKKGKPISKKDVEMAKDKKNKKSEQTSVDTNSGAGSPSLHQRKLPTVTQTPFGSSDKPSIKSYDLFNNLLDSQGEQITVDLTIVGDPTLIKQDDIFYTSLKNPSTGMVAGSYSYEVGMLPVFFTYNTGYDYDDKNGLISSKGTDFFSGIYFVLSIDHIFQKGKFSQKLNIVRLMYDEQKVNELYKKVKGKVTSTTAAEYKKDNAREKALYKKINSVPTLPNPKTALQSKASTITNTASKVPVNVSTSTIQVGPQSTMSKIGSAALTGTFAALGAITKVAGAAAGALEYGFEGLSYLSNAEQSIVNKVTSSPLVQNTENTVSSFLKRL